MTFEKGNNITESLRTLSLQPTDSWKLILEYSKSTDKRKTHDKIEIPGEHKYANVIIY